MIKEEIRWAAIQPLTGGMYLGAENAIGHPAEFILSFKGLNDIKKNKNDEITNCGNERNLTNYLKKHNRMPAYYIFNNRAMFDVDNNMKQEIVDESGNPINIYERDYDLDLVVAVPICSGLSSVSTFGEETKNVKNCNMKFIAEYTLSELKPRVYIFENAPALFTSKGETLRNWFNALAKKYGYTVTYFKTDTQLHKNCQRRPRTFVFFFKKTDENDTPRIINFVNEHISATDYFKAIPKGLKYEVSPWRYYSKILMDFFLAEYGDNWREKMHKKDLVGELCSQNMFDKFRKFTDDYDLSDKHKAAWHRKINDVEYKYNHGLGFFMFTPKMSIDTCPAVMFRNIENTIHPYENRLINIRENMELMGMPHDFELAVDDIYAGRVAYQLGQNVPVKTAEYVVSEAVRILLNWNVKDKNVLFPEDNNYCMLDNIKQKRIA